jgi:hypothetical protein
MDNKVQLNIYISKEDSIMSKLNEKMKEVNENVVDVKTEEVKNVENETENEEFMTVKVPKAKGYAMLANGEATEVETEEPAKEEVKEKENKGLLSRIKNSKVAKGIAIGVAVVGGVAAGIAMGKNGKNSDEVTFEDVPPQGLPDNYQNYPTYDQVDVETENEEV